MIHFIYPWTEKTRPWSKMNTLAVKLARKHYPDKKIIIWTNWLQGVPDVGHVIVRQTELPLSLHKYPQYISDYFRLKLLYEQGGMYLDTDMLLLKPVPEDFFLSWESHNLQSICNAIIQAEPGNAFIKEWLDAMPEAMESNTWAYGGVVLPAELSRKYKLKLYDSTFACPLDLSLPWMFDPDLKEQARQKCADSYAIHGFETYWRDYNQDAENNFFHELWKENQ